MELTKQVLENYGACYEGMLWYTSNGEPASVEETIEKLLDSDECEKFEWSNWLLSRVLPVDDKIRYAIFAAELVLDIFEKEFPEDKRPRNAIEATRVYLSHKDAAAAGAAYDAAGAAYEAARDAADVAAYAARDAAAYVARAAADATYTTCAHYVDYVAADAAACAADYAADAVRVADEADEDYAVAYTKIINYGLSLIGKCDVHCCKTQD